MDLKLHIFSRRHLGVITIKKTLTSIAEKYEFIFGLALALLIGMLSVSHFGNGVSLSMDSLYYLNGAINFYHGNGISVQLNEIFEPITLWPPLYSILLSLFCGIDECNIRNIQGYVFWLNLAMLYLSTVLFYFIVRIWSQNWIALIIVLAFVFLPGVQIIYLYAWSEVVFIPLILSSFYLLQLFVKNPKKYVTLYCSILILALATYVRYIGVAFCFAFLISVLLIEKSPLVSRIKLLGKLGTLYAVAIIPLLFRNYSNSGSLYGSERGIPDFRLFEDLQLLMNLLIGEFFSLNVLWALISIGLLILAIAILIANNNKLVGNDRIDFGQFWLPFTWLLVYWLFLLTARNVQSIDLDIRMLAVSWPFLLLIFSFLLTSFPKSKVNNRLSQLAFGLLFVAIGYSGMSVHNKILMNKEQFEEVAWINGIYYPNINGKRFISLNNIARVYPLEHNSWIITDISRPIILSYFFPNAKIMTLANFRLSDNSINYNELAKKEGLLVLENVDSIKQIQTAYGSNIPIKVFKSPNAKAQYIVTALPIHY